MMCTFEVGLVQLLIEVLLPLLLELDFQIYTELTALAVQRTAPQESPRTPAIVYTYVLLPQHRD